MFSVLRPDTGTNWLFNRYLNGDFVALFLIFCVTMFLRLLVTLRNSVRRTMLFRNFFLSFNPALLPGGLGFGNATPYSGSLCK